MDSPLSFGIVMTTDILIKRTQQNEKDHSDFREWNVPETNEFTGWDYD